MPPPLPAAAPVLHKLPSKPLAEETISAARPTSVPDCWLSSMPLIAFSLVLCNVVGDNGGLVVAVAVASEGEVTGRTGGALGARANWVAWGGGEGWAWRIVGTGIGRTEGWRERVVVGELAGVGCLLLDTSSSSGIDAGIGSEGLLDARASAASFGPIVVELAVDDPDTLEGGLVVCTAVFSSSFSFFLSLSIFSKCAPRSSGVYGW